MSCSTGKRTAKSPGWLQAQVTAVALALTAAHPSLRQAPWAALYHRQAGTACAVGQVKVIRVPPAPGPQRKVRLPKGSPQSVVRAKPVSLAEVAAEAAEVAPPPLLPPLSAAAPKPTCPALTPPPCCSSTAAWYASAGAAASATRARAPARAGGALYTAAMPLRALAREGGQVRRRARGTTALLPTSRPIMLPLRKRTTERLRRGMVMKKGVEKLRAGAAAPAAGLATLMLTTRESMDRVGMRS